MRNASLANDTHLQVPFVRRSLWSPRMPKAVVPPAGFVPVGVRASNKRYRLVRFVGG